MGVRSHMKKKSTTAVLAIAILAVIAVSVKLAPAIAHAHQSCRTFNNFVGHVNRQEWQAADAMLKADPGWIRIEGTQILYYGRFDITEKMSRATPRFWKTLEYYLTDNTMGDKVIFQASSVADYARLKDGALVKVKLP